MTKPSVILFDIGKVLIGWNQKRLLDKVFQETGLQDTPDIHALFKGWNDAWDAGCMRELAQEQIRDYPAHAPLIRGYCDHWEVSLEPVFEGTVAIMKELKTAGCRLYAASNFATDTFEIARPHMPFLDLFDGIQISGRINLCKPDPAFWQKMMADFRFRADEALFVDDRKDNIEAAKALGITSILFQNPEQLRLDMTALNLLPTLRNQPMAATPMLTNH